MLNILIALDKLQKVNSEAWNVQLSCCKREVTGAPKPSVCSAAGGGGTFTVRV